MATGADIVNYAAAQIGDPYVYGAAGPSSFDCSGLVQYVYKHFGLTTPRTTYQMVASNSNLQPIQRSQLQAGDLIFSAWDGEQANGHVAIYTGRNSVIEAPEPGKDVVETPLNSAYFAHATAYRRVPGLSGGGTSSTPASATLTVGPGGSGGGSLVNGIDQTLLQAYNVLTGASDVTTALVGMGEGVIAGAHAAGDALGILERMLLPTNLMRAALFFFGTIWVLIGIWLIASEARSS